MGSLSVPDLGAPSIPGSDILAATPPSVLGSRALGSYPPFRLWNVAHFH